MNVIDYWLGVKTRIRHKCKVYCVEIAMAVWRYTRRTGGSDRKRKGKRRERCQLWGFERKAASIGGFLVATLSSSDSATRVWFPPEACMWKELLVISIRSVVSYGHYPDPYSEWDTLLKAGTWAQIHMEERNITLHSDNTAENYA